MSIANNCHIEQLVMHSTPIMLSNFGIESLVHSIGRDHHLHRYDLLCLSNDIEEAGCSLKAHTNPKSTILKASDAVVLCHILNAIRGFENIVKP